MAPELPLQDGVPRWGFREFLDLSCVFTHLIRVPQAYLKESKIYLRLYF